MHEGEERIEKLAKTLYEVDGFNYGCLPTDQAWKLDREDVRERYRQIARDLAQEIDHA